MPQAYLSELQLQLNAIAQRLKEIENAAYEGPLSNPFTKETKDEYWRLRHRRDEIRQQIIDYGTTKK